MQIGLVGAGMIGQALAVRFAGAGHEVMISNSRGPETIERLARSIPGHVESGTVADAARFAKVVAVAIPTDAIRTLPAEALAGRTVIDVNNYYPSPGRRLPALDTGKTTSSELLSSLLPGASVVKAFNTIYFRRLLDDSRPDLPLGQRLAVPVAGDDPGAKRAVIGLVDEIGFTGVDAGTLADSARQQPGSRLYLAYAESRRRGTTLNPAQLRDLLAAG